MATAVSLAKPSPRVPLMSAAAYGSRLALPPSRKRFGGLEPCEACGASEVGSLGRDDRDLRLEKTVRGILRGALLGGGGFQALDLASEQRDALVQFFQRQQRQILADLVADLLARAV